MLPVSGAEQLMARGAMCVDQPVSSASGAYSVTVSPDSEGRKRFQRPRLRASIFSSSTTGGSSWLSQARSPRNCS